MTLTQTATITKRAIVLTVILIVMTASAKIGYQIWYQHYLSTLPKAEDRPDQRFGTLPNISFPPNNVSSSNYTYTLDTQTGDFPKLPSSGKVYFIPQAGLSLLAPEKSKALATKLGFTQGPEILSPTSYQFSDGNSGTLLIDLPTANFKYQRNVASPSADLVFQGDQQSIANDFKDYLASVGLLPSDLHDGSSQATFNQNNPSRSNMAEISLLPTPIDELPIVTPTNKGLVKVKAYAHDKQNVAESSYASVEYTYWPIDTSTVSTYPLKTPTTALNELKSGVGYVIVESLSPQVSITDVYLAYYESSDYTPYLQPMYVFEGQHFKAIVPAVNTTSAK